MALFVDTVARILAALTVALGLGTLLGRPAAAQREAPTEKTVETQDEPAVRLLDAVRATVALMALGAFLAGVLLVMFGALTQGAAIAISVALVVALALHEVVGRRRTSVVVRGDRVEQRKQEAESGQDVADQHRRS